MLRLGRPSRAVLMAPTALLFGLGLAALRAPSTVESGQGATVAPVRPASQQDLSVSFGGKYCPFGQEVDLERAKRLADFPVFMPAHRLADESHLRTIWWCPGGSFLSIEFESGVRVIIEKNVIPDPSAKWASWAAEYREAEVSEVRGTSALVVDPAKDPTGKTPGGLHFVEHGLHFIVAGNVEIALSELIGVAESLRPE